jgi:hypothetical protein
MGRLRFPKILERLRQVNTPLGTSHTEMPHFQDGTAMDL